VKKVKLLLCSLISGISALSIPTFSAIGQELNTVKNSIFKEVVNKDVVEVKKIFDKKDKNNVFIDVREYFEWEEGVIPNALKISLGNIPKSIEKLDKSKNYILVCRSGVRSTKAYKIMQQAGFKNLTNLNGGMLSWYREGYSVNK
jgi:rhodanese-related sulfurtransferase